MDSRTALTGAVSPVFADAVAEMRAFVLRGGKRVRPTFAWSGWRCAGGGVDVPEATATLQVCAALELIQACALIHDDIIDLSDTRRGFPTVHREFAARHRDHGWAGDSDHFGMSTAILLGDLALSWSDDMVADAGLAPEARDRMAPIWAAMRTEVLGGQYLDILSEATGDESPEAARRVMRFKTAAYTVTRPLQLGAALAGASDDLLASLATVGDDLGTAFQQRDDLLGVFGDPAQTGKPSGDDLVAGKRTALLADALARADDNDPAAARLLRASVGHPLTDTQLSEIRGVLTDLGSVAAVEDDIAARVEAAVTELRSGPADPGAADDLIAFGRRLADRAA
nr:polyprenyl synthetase family protein [Williamsia sterculiae]